MASKVHGHTLSRQTGREEGRETGGYSASSKLCSSTCHSAESDLSFFELTFFTSSYLLTVHVYVTTDEAF